MTLSTRLSATLILALSLTACGGGGGGSNTAPSVPTNPPVTPTASNMDEAFGKYLTDLTNNHILPGYQLLAENAERFVDKSTDFCALDSPTLVDLNLLRLGWLEVNFQWQTMQWLKQGAAIKNNRFLRIQYWPDDQDAVARGITDMLAEQQVIDVDYVASHNVGGQGIPAAERLLFPDSSALNLLNAVDKTKRCEVLQAIASNIANMTLEINQSWQPDGDNYADQLINGTDDFSSRKDAIEELVTNWLEQLERVKDEKMLIPLSDNPPGVPRLAEFNFSKSSLAGIKINIAVFKQIYSAGGGYGFDDILGSHLQQNTIATSMDEGINTLVDKVDAMQGTLPEMLSEESQRAEIKSLITAIQDFRTVLTADFVQAVDIYIGFNSSDGD